MFKAMIREISELAKAMGIPFEQDYVAINLDILSALPPETTTSMQRDVMAHKPSELEGLVNAFVSISITLLICFPFIFEPDRCKFLYMRI